jgi:hypothetical protein
MEFLVHTNNTKRIAELISDSIIIGDTQDALDMMADARELDSGIVIIHEHQVNPEFFDLKSGIAGDILQKFSNYRMKLAIVGNFTKYQSKSLRDFIFESNKHGQVCFSANVEDALNVLKK